MKQLFAWLAGFGPWGLLGLSFVESLGIPNPGGTDFALVAFAAARPGDAFLAAILATLGSLLGSAIFFEITRKGGEAFLDNYTKSGRGRKFRDWYRHYGLVTVFIAALVPIPILPLKVFIACAGALGVSRGKFQSVLAVARLPRYFALAYLGSRLGPDSWPWIKSHFLGLGMVALVLFVVLFGAIWLMDRARLAQAAEG